MVGVSDVSVLAAAADNHPPEHAQEIAVPSTVSGQLVEGDERHWYAVRAQRGEVFWLEAFGERIGSPVELGVAVLDPSGQRELTKLAGYNLPGDALVFVEARLQTRWMRFQYGTVAAVTPAPR